MQSSLQEIIAAQKLQAAYAQSQTQLRPSSSPHSHSPHSNSIQSQSMPNVLAGTGGGYRGVSSSSSSFFTASHFVVPHAQHAQQHTQHISTHAQHTQYTDHRHDRDERHEYTDNMSPSATRSRDSMHAIQANTGGGSAVTGAGNMGSGIGGTGGVNAATSSTTTSTTTSTSAAGSALGGPGSVLGSGSGLGGPDGVRVSLDEDQKSDNTTQAGTSTDSNYVKFKLLGITHAET